VLSKDLTDWTFEVTEGDKPGSVSWRLVNGGGGVLAVGVDCMNRTVANDVINNIKRNAAEFDVTQHRADQVASSGAR
jgi:hypothetical protein